MFRRVFTQTFQNKTLLLITLMGALLVSVYRDIRNANVVPADMRNRIMGSRMIDDGLSPYFYIWQKGDPIRYYDPTSPLFSDSLHHIVSLATSTPFFHHVTSLVASLPQYQLNTFWFVLQYFCLGLCLLLVVQADPVNISSKKKWVLAAIAIAFTYTIGWRNHVLVGQNYIFLPVMAMGCYYSIKQKSNLLHLLLFAVFACSMVLLRPIALLFFLPFLLYVKTYFKWLIGAAVMMVAYVVFVWFNPVQKNNWTDYFESVQIHTKAHQRELPEIKIINHGPAIHSFEGVDLDSEGNSGSYGNQLRKGLENSNFFIFYEQLTGKKIPVKIMTALGLFICLLLLLPLVYLSVKKQSVPVESLLLLGFLIYNTFEFFTPVTRANYHWVQFIFPLLLTALYMKRIYLIPIALLAIGFYLNIIVWPSVKMEHNIGEAMIVLGILLSIYRMFVTKFIKEERLQISNTVYLI